MNDTDVTVRPLEEADLGEADRIMRLAFGTFLGRAQLIGVTMHKPDESAYHDASAWVIDDWR